MNTRLQVEHPVTEAITGIDLVHEQIRVASGGGLSVTQEDIRFSGHAIECRINAEDPRTFVPSPGTITHFHTPGGLGVRVDSGVYSGYRIPPYYDSLIGKLIVHGRTRVECMMRLRRALDEFVVDGIKTTLPLFRDLVGNPDIANGDYDIHWLEKYLAGPTRIGRFAMTRPYAPGHRIPTGAAAQGLCLRRVPDGRKRGRSRRSSGSARKRAASFRSTRFHVPRSLRQDDPQEPLRHPLRHATSKASSTAAPRQRDDRANDLDQRADPRSLCRAASDAAIATRSRHGGGTSWSAASTA